MNERDTIFHLSIPCADLDAAEAFYVNVLGCRRARRYHDRITLDFFGDQVVCHLSPEAVMTRPQPYPRHFGITFKARADFDALITRLRKYEANFSQPVATRFAGKPEEHLTTFISDPSNNVLEFKHYLDPEMMY